MRKTITAFIFALSLILSVIGPTILTALELNRDDIAWINFAEEESQESVSKVVEDAKQISQQNFCNAQVFAQSDSKRLSRYLESAPNFTTDVNLPPPKNFV